jgi:hypothetical protein
VKYVSRGDLIVARQACAHLLAIWRALWQPGAAASDPPLYAASDRPLYVLRQLAIGATVMLGRIVLSLRPRP